MKATHVLTFLAVVVVGTAVAQQATQTPATPAATAAPTAAPAATAPPPAAASVKEAPAKAGDPKAGAQKAGVCAACHGVDGNSADPVNPRIAGQHERYIARQLALFKSGERNNAIMMPQAANLSAQDMRDIGAYFAMQKPQNAGVADETVIKAGPYSGMKYYEVGQKIYRYGRDGVAACAACHGPVGRGNPGPSYPSIGGQHASYTQAKLSEFRNGLVWGQGDNAKAQMAEIANKLTEEEVAALSTYLQGLHDVRDVPVAKK
jgi:cytochrome c553